MTGVSSALGPSTVFLEFNLPAIPSCLWGLLPLFSLNSHPAKITDELNCNQRAMFPLTHYMESREIDSQLIGTIRY